MNAQKVFNQVTNHLLLQCEACEDARGYKAYAYDGKYSAIGFYLKQWAPSYLTQIEGVDPEDTDCLSGGYRDLLLALENVHDHHAPSQWVGQFHAVAKEFGLIFQGVAYRSGEPEMTMIEHTFSLTFKVRSHLENAGDIPDEELIAHINQAERADDFKDNLDNTYSKPVRKQPFAVTIGVTYGPKYVITLTAYDAEDARQRVEEDVLYVRPVSWATYNNLQGLQHENLHPQ